MNVGKNIFEYRKNKNLSQEEFADLIGVTRQTISNWELSITLPDTNQLIILSKIMNISIDDLVNNDVKNIIVEKVKNTEKLAEMIIKILKTFGGIIITLFVILVMMVIIFNVFRKEPESSSVKSRTLSCSIENNDYLITIGSDSYFNCSNCDSKMQVYLRDITDWANIETSTKNINKYFSNNGGYCTTVE